MRWPTPVPSHRETGGFRKRYSGETRFPLVLQNIHRYFWYFTLIFAGLLTYDAIEAFRFPGGIGMGLGTVILVVNAVFIWAYQLGCHACRHLTGGNLRKFSASPVRLWIWTQSHDAAQQAPPALRLAVARLDRGLRPLHLPRRLRHLHRSEDLLMAETERHDFDVVVIGAGGAGLRAAIEARQMGARTALVCKSLLGKAHTVMAEGGIAAALGSVWPQDNWEVHFRDTMRGGKMLNNWRMAQIHALEAPDRVLELEEWGALFDRTTDGRILQRDFGGHRYARLAHVGDRTGLEMIRALQHRAVSIGIDVFMECKIIRLLQDDAGAVNGAVGFWRETGGFVTFGAKAVVLATGGLGKAWKFTTNSWECTGDGMGLALWAGADLIDMEAIQFHPTGMVWPPSARGLLVTEGVRGDGGVLKNREGERFMFNYISPFFAAETARHSGGRPVVHEQGRLPPPAGAASPRRGRHAPSTPR